VPISRVRVHHQLQPFRRGSYRMHHGSAPAAESFVVALESDDGPTGYGEIAMLGGFYSEAFPAGARAGLADLAPLLVGRDATRPRAVLAFLDEVLRGQAYVKSAIDMACWDAAARAAGLPLCDLAGGRLGTAVALYEVVVAGGSDEDAIALARDRVAAGYRRLQVKVGGDPDADGRRLRLVREAVGADVVLFADANGGFTTAGTRRFLRATRDLDYTLEQPCATYDECAAIRSSCDRALVLDESIETLADLLRAHREGVADGITIKLGRVGGVTHAALVRDVACELGVQVSIESTGGASIGTAAFIHLGLGVPERLRVHTVDFQRWWTVDNATGLPPAVDGAQAAPDGPGLGVVVELEALGEPIVDVAAGRR
jgi:L-alanine-DL-glutamate epimerase-like enolase superfamily enzyme